MSDEKCRERLVARVISTLNHLSQPLNTSGMVECFTTAILDAVGKEAPLTPRRHRRHGWCESAEPLAAFILAWTARKDERQFLRAHPLEKNAWKTLRSACANLQKVIAAGLDAYCEAYLAEIERLLANNGERGFYKHRKNSVGLEGTKAKSEQLNRDEDGMLLRGKVRVRERWGSFTTNVRTRNRLNSIPRSSTSGHHDRLNCRSEMNYPWTR